MAQEKQKPAKSKNNVAFQCDAVTLQKIKTMADNEGWSYVDVYNKAFAKLVEVYEAKNGPIKPKSKKTSLENL